MPLRLIIIVDPDHEIEFTNAEKSIDFERGLAAHFQTSADQKQRLLDIARSAREQATFYKQLYEKEKEKNERLEARVAELEAHVTRLEARPQYEVGTYIEKQNVQKQILPFHPNEFPEPNVNQLT